MPIQDTVLRFLRRQAVGTLALRAGIVGANFAVMLWLTWRLGFATFGGVIFVWGAALVASAVISLGGPLILLRALSGGSGLHWHQFAGVVLVGPAVLAVASWSFLAVTWPDPRWGAVLYVGFAVNLLGCLASMMRAAGSVQTSMVLRDAGPFCALGLAVAMTPAGTITDILFATLIILTAMAITSVAWCLQHRAAFPVPTGNRCFSGSLWGTTVLGMVIGQIDLIIGGALMGAEALGIYAFLRRIANLVALPVTVATWMSAKPVAAAYAASNPAALRAASAQGSRIAWYPSLALCGLCILGLITASLTPYVQVSHHAAGAFCILLAGAMVQSYLASGFTVATLGDHAHLSAIARGLTVISYALLAAATWSGMTPISNAAIYVIAMSLGSAVVWSVILRDLGVDTSARVLRQAKGARWKTS